MRARLKIAVIGIGHKGRSHVENINKLTEKFQLVAVADSSEESVGEKRSVEIKEII